MPGSRMVHVGAVLTSAAALLFAAGCGSGKTSTAGAAPSGSPAPGGDRAAYLACLRQHGVNVPTARPTGGARPFPRPTGDRSAFAAARQACQSLAPRRTGPGMAALQAFRSCMTDHGVTLPTAAPGGGVRALDRNDPKVAAALKVCRVLLPSRGPRPTASS